MQFLSRRGAGLVALLLLLTACASDPPPRPAPLSPNGAGVDALAQQLHRAAWREPGDAPRVVFIGLALDGKEGVFDRDVALMDALFARQFGRSYRSIRLSNTPSSNADRRLPLAQPSTLRETADSLARSHRPGDRYVLLFSTHGIKGGKLAVHQPHLYPGPWSWQAVDIAASLSSLPPNAPQWVIVSACYSGAMLPALQRPNRLLLAAAHAERTSFGCGGKFANTWFVRELHDALAAGGSWRQVWASTQARVLKREKDENHTPSEPQSWADSAWQKRMDRPWQEL